MAWLLRSIAGLLLSFALGIASAQTSSKPVRVGMTPAFLHDQHGLLADWRKYMEVRLKRPVEFVQRDSYRETMDLMRLEKLDFAWICDYPFIHLKQQVRLLAVPLYQGRPYYRSYLIVPDTDVHTTTYAQLKGAVFAYADPYSNTGYLAPRYQLQQIGEDPGRFFTKTFFTWSHRKAIDAIAMGLAQGAAVDSYVWDSLARVNPGVTARTRVVAKSPEYAFPPFVAHRSVGEAEFSSMQKLLMDMPKDPEGARLLQRLNLDGFITGEPRMYDSVAQMMRAFGEE
jgi:phosphonate transport system substrate-binding protein